LLDWKANQPKKISYGIVSSESLFVTEEFYLYCWDGKTLFQLATFRFPKIFSEIAEKKAKNNTIAGMQIIGRGIHNHVLYVYFLHCEI